jgi:glucose/arabinose dehydrogenase
MEVFVRAFVALCVVAAAAATVAGAATPPRVAAVSLPANAVVNQPWRAVVAVRASVSGVLVARGPGTVRAPLVRMAGRGRYAATLRFPATGVWAISASVAGRSTRLGRVNVDVQREPLLADPFTIAVEPTGSLLVGQLREGALVRIANGRATSVAPGGGVFHVYSTANGTYVTARDGAVHRLDGSSLTRLTPPLDASSVAVDARGNLYVTIYAGYIRKVAPDGTVTTIAGDGTEGYAGDGGPAASARLFHPHSVAIGADGALYVADTENRRIRRIDLGSGRITTFGGDVGVTVSLAAAPDGSIYSADVVRNGAGGGVVRVASDETTTRILSSSTANGVAVAADGTVYVNLWESKRILRLDPATGRPQTVARG